VKKTQPHELKKPGETNAPEGIANDLTYTVKVSGVQQKNP